MSNFHYLGQLYTQGRSEVRLVTFTASAADILRWGGVPSKNERFHGGFQRALGPRYRKIVEYFNKNQASPGAIVVAFRKDSSTLLKLGYPSEWPADKDLATLPQFVRLSFSTKEGDDEASIPKLIERVRHLLQSRPGFSASDNDDDAVTKGEDEVQISVDVDANQDSEEDDDELDVGQSKLSAFYRFISSPEAVDDWLKSESKKISELKEKKNPSTREREYMQFSADEKLRYTLLSLIRPAMIVDGQHRVNGANESEQQEVLFTVCAILDADWVEQVYQFVILNKMAKPISKDFLTELLNTSLTNSEIEQIDKRLEIVGIKNADRRIHKFINHDPRSPFSGLIAEAGEVPGIDKSEKLSQQGMLTLAKRWRSIAGPGKSKEMNCFLPYLDVNTLGDGRKKWEEYETWINLFFAFWAEVKKKYDPEQVWVKKEKYHLLYIVTLQALQDLFIESKAIGRVRFTSLEDFRSQVRDFFEPVPAAFFRNWTETGLQSGQGWTAIKLAVEMFQNGQRLQSVEKESSLYASKK
jgi:hypothetical protein